MKRPKLKAGGYTAKQWKAMGVETMVIEGELHMSVNGLKRVKALIADGVLEARSDAIEIIDVNLARAEKMRIEAKGAKQ